MAVRREVLILVGLVVVIDVVFIAAYFLGGIDRSSDQMKLLFTVVWTVITLVVVLRGLLRIRQARVPRDR
jgi:membrane protein DedA with SNARE-associated domain